MPDDVPATDASGAPAPTVAATPNVTLPVFSTTNAAPWFLRVEALFRLKKITANAKSDYIIGALPEDVFNRISTWLVSWGSEAIPYDELKAKIITHCEPSPEEKSQKILDLLRLPLGDQRPSDALYEIKNLSTILNPDGSTSQIDLSRVLWMLRLPQEIRTHITDFSTKSEQDLARQADSLRGTSKLALAHPTTAAAQLPLPDDDEDDDVIAAAQQRFQRSSNQRQFSGVSRKTLCYFHKRFGRDAKNCRPPCFHFN